MHGTDVAVRDFEEFVLSTMPGLWARLRYTADLKENDGVYTHMALAAMHGQDIAVAAIGRVHRQLFETVLQSDLWDLLADLKASAADAGEDCIAFTRQLCDDALLPADLHPGETEHMESVVVALQLLYRTSAGGR